MNISYFIDSLKAFNLNAVYNFLYIMTTNWWFLLIAASAIICIVVSLKDEIDHTVIEEQQIL